MAAINMYHLRRIFVPESDDGLIVAATSNGTPGPAVNGTSSNSVKDLNGTEKLENIPKEKVAEFRSKCTVILLDELTKIGRNPELVDVVLNSKTHSNMISRNHSEIHGVKDENGKYKRYYIVDNSLNGTYINETRAQGDVELHEGDIIKFGHVNGAAIKAGNFAPQQYAEFVFRFEKAFPNHKYMGFNADGQRVKTLNARGAYMQINSESQKPRPCPPLINQPAGGLSQPVTTQTATVVSTTSLPQAKVPYLEELLQTSAAAAASASTNVGQTLLNAAAAGGQSELSAAWNALRLQQSRYYANPAALAAAAYLQQNSNYAAFWPNPAAWRTSITGTTQDAWNQFNSASLANPSLQLRVPGLAYPQAIGGQQSMSTEFVDHPIRPKAESSSTSSVFSSTGAIFASSSNSSLPTSNTSTTTNPNPFSSLASPSDIAARLGLSSVTVTQSLTPQAQQLAAQLAAARIIQNQQQLQQQQQQHQHHQQQQQPLAQQQRLAASNSYIPNSGSGGQGGLSTVGHTLPLAEALAAVVSKTQNSTNIANKTPTSGHFVFDTKPTTSSTIQSGFQKPKDPTTNPTQLHTQLSLDTNVRADISTLAAAATLCAGASPTISPRKQISPLVNTISSIKKVEDSRRGSTSSADEKAMKKEELDIPSDPSTSTTGSDNGATDKASVKRMECDSSVPSPPKNQHNIADTIISAANSPNHIPSSPPRAPRPSCRSDSQSPPPITAVERSDSSNESRSSSRSDNHVKDKTPEPKKPAPIGRTASVSKKVGRKSNEVEQLLKDLCDGNNMWSHMRRMELQKPSSTVKEVEKKKILRLEERQKKIIEKKKGHKMMRQISDESSEGESDNESEKKKQWSSSDSDEEPEVSTKAKEPTKKKSAVNSKVKPKETKAKTAWDTPAHSASSAASTSLLVKAATAITSAGRMMATQKRKRLLANDTKDDKKNKVVKEKSSKKLANEKKTSNTTNNRRRARKNSTRSSEDEEDILKTRPFTKGRLTPSDVSDVDDDDAPSAPKRFSSGLSFALNKKEPSPVNQSTTSGDLWETCAFRNCKKPQAESLNWVQCDDCCAWYHTFCILGKEVGFEEDESFSCGCKLQEKPTKKKLTKKSTGRKVT